MIQATVCAKFGLQCIVYMGKKVGCSLLLQTACCKCALVCTSAGVRRRDSVRFCAAYQSTRLLKQQDMERQQLNVFRMRLLGAEVREVAAGTATLKVGGAFLLGVGTATGRLQR